MEGGVKSQGKPREEGWEGSWGAGMRQPWLGRRRGGRGPPERIWPFGDLFGVFPHHVILAEEEEGPVDRQAVLPDGDGVVESHGAGSLGHRLLVHPLCPRGPALAATPCTPAASTACCSPGASSPDASSPVAGRHLISKPSHPAESKGPGVTMLRMLLERSSSHPISCCPLMPGGERG